MQAGRRTTAFILTREPRPDPRPHSARNDRLGASVCDKGGRFGVHGVSGERPPGDPVTSAPAEPDLAERRTERRDFRRMWLGQSISLIGDQVSLFALPSLAILRRSRFPCWDCSSGRSWTGCAAART